ncbi:hypothetical protein [Streptomyces turgidiscabies]|uniref:Uncharacterized protein n=1 Tax=Streptomyces turgidiscabies TaxID=85558 RepID=A0ABU0S103_9ACTN|nr:hypothetical protein [Streptomyces turgidiscabies]MDQ0937896.1 hypothetical protein [Streptomyces turgidiscabies]
MNAHLAESCRATDHHITVFGQLCQLTRHAPGRQQADTEDPFGMP